MDADNDRLRERISNAELERRWALVRAIMAEQKLDALIVGGAGQRASGALAWLTGLLASDGNLSTVLFPIDGLMTLIEHGADGFATDLGGREPTRRGVGRRLTTNSHIWSVAYTAHQDGELLVKEARRCGYSRIGVVGPSRMYAGVWLTIKEGLGDRIVADLTSEIDLLKAIKSEAELNLIRRCASLQDLILSELRGHLRPGLHDFEVSAFAEYLGKLHGSDLGIYVGSSSPAGTPAVFFRDRLSQGRKLEHGDVYSILIECAGPGGYFTEIVRSFVLGKAPAELVDANAQLVEAQHHNRRQYRPGARCGDIFATYNEYMRAHGLPEEKRLHSHGQGYDLVERPLIRPEEEMLVQENMNFSMHPSLVTERVAVVLCDNFFIGPDGASELIHQTPQEIIEAY